MVRDILRFYYSVFGFVEPHLEICEPMTVNILCIADVWYTVKRIPKFWNTPFVSAFNSRGRRGNLGFYFLRGGGRGMKSDEANKSLSTCPTSERGPCADTGSWRPTGYTCRCCCSSSRSACGRSSRLSSRRPACTDRSERTAWESSGYPLKESTPPQQPRQRVPNIGETKHSSMFLQ
jgi:hypothetical protein